MEEKSSSPWGELQGESRTIGLTDAKYENFEFCWILKNFSLLPDEVTSPEFEGGIESKHIWFLKLNPKKKVGQKQCLAIYLVLKNFFGDLNEGNNSNSEVELKVKAKIEITAFYNDQDYFLTTETEFNSKSKRSCGWSDYLYNPGIISGDCIKFQIKIWLSHNELIKQILKRSRRLLVTDSSVPEKNFKRLRSDFESLYKTSLHSDIDIICEDEVVLKAHKSVLSIRSPVFNRMFDTDMAESSSSVVKIEDFKRDTVEKMLEFIYTGRTNFSKEDFPELFQIGEKYDLVDLKTDCEDGIIQVLTLENAAEMLILADKFRAPTLKSNSIDFIIRNKREVAKTRGFKELVEGNEALIAEIFLTEAGYNSAK